MRRRIAYLFQGAALFDSLDVGENVAYGLREQFWNTMSEDEITRRVAQSLELVGLPGIEAMRPSDLSGGMKKRVGLARTLALQPEVILYDEPTTGLDPINTARINHLIIGIKRALKLTSIVVTHDMGTAFAVSDRLAMLGRGRVLFVRHQGRFRRRRATRSCATSSKAMHPRPRTSRRSSRRRERYEHMTKEKQSRGRSSSGGLLILAVGVFLIGENRKFWERKVTYNAVFYDVAGLEPGSPVRMGGVDVGTVSKVKYSEDPKDPHIYVQLEIVRSQVERIRKPVYDETGKKRSARARSRAS